MSHLGEHHFTIIASYSFTLLVLITIIQMPLQLQCGIGKIITYIVGEEDIRIIGQKLV